MLKKTVAKKLNASWPGFHLKVFLKSLTLTGRITDSYPDAVVCGMQRSGSTLLYNIMKLLIMEKHFRADTFSGTEKQYQEALKSKEPFVARKIHEYTLLLKRRIENGYTKAFYTHRNLLDVLASYKQKGWIAKEEEIFERQIIEELVFTALSFKKLKNINLIAYNDLYFNKIEVIRKVAKIINVELSDVALQRIDNETSLEKSKAIIKNEQLVTTMDKTVLNTRTGLHKNHINNPKPNKWEAVLTPDFVATINKHKLFNLYRDEFGYEA